MTPPPPSEGTYTFTRSCTSSSKSPRKPRIVDLRELNTFATSAGDGTQRYFSHFAREEPVQWRGLHPPLSTWSPVAQPVVTKLRPSGGGPGIDCSKNAIDVLVDQCSAFSSETDRVGGSTTVWRLEMVNGKGRVGFLYEGGRVILRPKATCHPSPTFSIFPSTFSSSCQFHYTIHTYVLRPLGI